MYVCPSGRLYGVKKLPGLVCNEDEIVTLIYFAYCRFPNALVQEILRLRSRPEKVDSKSKIENWMKTNPCDPNLDSVSKICYLYWMDMICRFQWTYTIVWRTFFSTSTSVPAGISCSKTTFLPPPLSLSCSVGSSNPIRTHKAAHFTSLKLGGISKDTTAYRS
jgi:hypothetical protein